MPRQPLTSVRTPAVGGSVSSSGAPTPEPGTALHTVPPVLARPGHPFTSEDSMTTITDKLRERLASLEYRLRDARIVVQNLETAHSEMQQAVWDAERIDAEAKEQPTPSPHPGERIIRELESAGRALVLAELAARCKLTTQQVSDALRPLVRCGDVERVGRGIYRRVGVRP